ncbi:hypothetical protein IFM89_019767 [Coptis chinensis]|uniref:Neprosin PEP catalytic domain-containing protein n=1 Tax=Coptis chinensis TaxID=261450 RepID=A0A835I3V2_9MAGN|nr:hypothetical protein IFM89_019767 [Coptis chinensis]
MVTLRTTRRDSSFSVIVVMCIVFIVFFKGCTVVLALNYTNHKRVSSLRLERIQRHLNKINKPAIKTIESPDGDIIDCVRRHEQPAFDHPLLRNHRIQRVPSERPRFKVRNEENEIKNYNGSEHAWQVWHQRGDMCPKGTVPIRRSSVHDVLRAKSLYHYGKKPTRLHLDRRVDAPDVGSGNAHEHAFAHTGRSQEIYGAKAAINVWDPKVEVVKEFSLSQIWIISGSFNDSGLNTIEAGWQAYPHLYGDSRPRLFTYWTRDAYQATGCYNLLCAAFVQTNNKIAIGAAISPVSSVSSNQYDITILIWKDPKQGCWWLALDDTVIGYWPAELFTRLADHATSVEWGGEVVNSRSNGKHTSTQMGSGHFAQDGFGQSSFFRNLEVVDADNNLSSAQHISTAAANPNCYDIKTFYSDGWGTHFYFGGPGYNPKCQ